MTEEKQKRHLNVKCCNATQDLILNDIRITVISKANDFNFYHYIIIALF